MSTVNEQFATDYNRAFNTVRNRIMLSAADIGKSLRIRVIGNGTIINRASGLAVKLFNTNAMLSAELPSVVGKLKPEQFNLVADAGDAEEVTKYIREVQNQGNVAFTVPLTNANITQLGQGAMVNATVVEYTKADGTKSIGLNFNTVIQPENGTSAASAFDALLAGTGVSGEESAPSADPFADTVATAPAKAATKPAKPAKAKA